MSQTLTQVPVDSPEIKWCRLILQLQEQSRELMNAPTMAGKRSAQIRRDALWSKMTPFMQAPYNWLIADWLGIAELTVRLNDEPGLKSA